MKMNRRNILLRFDDICPTMSWSQWYKAKSLMDKAGVVALLGVVPDCQDPALEIDVAKKGFWDYIKDLKTKGFTIAMHGYQHVFDLEANGLVTKNKISEFAGLPYDIQLEKIKKGKQILNSHGIDTDVFFAPAHSYDDNTLRALASCGFHYVSDGLSSKPYVRHGIKMLPCRSGGIPSITGKNGYLTAVVHAHEWLRKEKAIESSRFEQLLSNNSTDIVSFDDFKNWQSSNCFIQRLTELAYMYVKRTKMSLITLLRR